LRKLLYRILIYINAFFAFTLLLSYLSVHISPQDFALPAFFGLAYPYLLLINILLVLIWAFLLRYEAFISVVVIAIGFTHFSNYIRMGKPAVSKEGTFRVMSYNIRLFNTFENKNPNSEEKIIAFLRSRQPDIIFLQEFYVNGDPVQKDEAFRTALGGKYYSHMKLMGSGRNRYYGIVTYSKFPIIRKGQIIHPRSSSLSIFTDIVIEKDTFRIFNNHLQSFRLKRMEKSFLDEMMSTSEKETLSEVRSLSVSLRRGFIIRARQAEAVKAQVDNSPYPVIVAGDFNDTPVSYSYRKIRKGLNDSFVRSGYGAGFTYRGNYPPNRIDYILYDNSLESRYFEIIKVRYSDHYPIIVNLRKRP
jgi:endonuclease/exonuclease/phosphatase family metal-dependent hydrolase